MVENRTAFAYFYLYSERKLEKKSFRRLLVIFWKERSRKTWLKKTYLGRAGLLAILAAVLLVAPALAAVNFDSATGTGFVGKGDVQIALGYNNAQMQAQANSLAFTYLKTEIYSYDEVWDTNRKHHEVPVTTTVDVKGEIQYDARKANQVNGFILTGFKEGTSTTTGEIPVEGAVLVDPQTKKPYPTDHTVENVVLESSTGGLYVNGVLLPQV